MTPSNLKASIMKDRDGRPKHRFLASRREEVIESQHNEIKKLESKYARLYDEAPNLYRTINTDGIILECNRSYLRELGFDNKADVLGHSIFEHVSEDSLDALYDSFEEWKRTGTVRNKEVWFKRKDGSTFPALISANNLYDDEGNLIGSNSVIVDETEMYESRRKLEQAKQMQEEFIKIAAHELITPIQPILGYINLAKNKSVDNELALKIIYGNAIRLRQLATDILDVSRIDSGAMKYNMRKVEINHLVDEAIAATNHTLDHNDNTRVTIVAELDPTAGLEIMADPHRITQVIRNILDNAIKFTEHGTIKVLTRIDSESKRVHFEVRDTGAGISEHVMPRMFEKFTSQSSSDATKRGAGLGLYLAEKLVSAHGGTLWGMNNEDGIGARFGFSLPLQ
jgi:PAS domain S-box-containing protein